ncbi:MAG: hypothetical protein E3J72_14045 [Planctomycetota bacterium]|nr:MAG: hypothetical protein E3J72_14045 [Planctomycetota bacterium]
MPPGLELDNAGQIYGFPEQTGTWNFTAKVIYNSPLNKKKDGTDANPLTATKPFSITIKPPE